MSKDNFENNIYEQSGYNFGYYCPPIFRYPCDEDCDKASFDDRQTQPGMLDTPPPDTSFQSTTEPILTDIGYTQAFLKTQIGKRVRITFLIGTTNLTDRVGILDQVGVSYIVLKVPESNIRVLCDLYAIKFVDIFEPQSPMPSQNMMGNMQNQPGYCMMGMPYMGPRLDFDPSETL